jgi:hypothetical protein
MHATKVAEKLRAQIHQFSGIIPPHFSKPKTVLNDELFFASGDRCLHPASQRPLRGQDRIKQGARTKKRPLCEAVFS